MRKKSHERVPRLTELILPTFQALKELGGSGKNDEILACVIQNLHLPDAMVDLPHNGRASLSELAYRLAWARTYLKTYGVIENSSRCVWSILPEYTQVETLDVKRIVQAVVHRNVELQQNQPMDSGLNDEPEDEGVDVPDEVKPWRQRLQEILQTMDPTDLNGSPNASCANVGSRKSKLQKSPETESSTAPGNFVSTVFLVSMSHFSVNGIPVW